MLPIGAHFHRRGETATVKGMYIAGAIVGLLNVACWGAVLIDLSRGGRIQ